MSEHKKYGYKYQVIELDFAAINTTEEPQSLSTDKDYDDVVGIAVSFTDETQAPNTVFAKPFRIGSDDLFPDNYELKMLASSLAVGPPEKFAKANEHFTPVPAKGSTIVLAVKDGGNAFAAYKIRLVLLLRKEIKE